MPTEDASPSTPPSTASVSSPSARQAPASPPGLSERLRGCSGLADNDLADQIIEVAGQAVDLDLQMFLDALPGLERRSIALDAAIEVVLRSMTRAGMSEPRAARSLSDRFPLLARSIRTAYALSQAMAETRDVAASMSAGRTLSLPRMLGPRTADGSPRYDLHQLIGVGSQGAVYMAADRALSDPNHPAWVAVKRLHTDQAASGSDTVAEEALRARRVIHPNVVRVLDQFVDEERVPYVVYEFVRGSSLDGWRRTLPGRIPVRDAARLALQVARGIQAAHRAGLVHRDLKPSNVVIADGTIPKVTDFGIAVAPLTPAGKQQLGSVAFMAPEQFRLEPGAADTAADVYALGGLLFWLLTDRCPNGATTAECVEHLGAGSAWVGPLPRPGGEVLVDRDMDSICRRAMAPRASDRYGSADAFANDLESWLHHEPLAWSCPGPGHRLRLLFRRSPVLVSVSLASVVAAIAVGTWGAFAVGNARARASEARLRLAEQEIENRRGAEKRVGAVTTMLQFMIGRPHDDSAGAEWINLMTFLETVVGPNLLESDIDLALHAPRRIGFARDLVDRAVADGHGDDLETRLWELSLCVWLIRANEIDEVLVRLPGLKRSFTETLRPTDRWHDVLAVVENVADTMRADAAANDSLLARHASLERAEQAAAKLPSTWMGVQRLVERARKHVSKLESEPTVSPEPASPPSDR